MSKILTDHASLDEYMAVWFCAEVLDMVELRLMVVHCHTHVQESIWNCYHVIDHLENIKDCPTYGWLERLKENHEEDLAYLDVLNALVDKLCVVVRKKEKDVSEMDY
uniref:Uncharacterized protein n=1 Tax=Tanacetum cinerariifolium TaxID=118510 RepID=A0A6L2KT47_TANCI|nr:hypothetical protein [Tanacetum cinerariifolium]